MKLSNTITLTIIFYSISFSIYAQAGKMNIGYKGGYDSLHKILTRSFISHDLNVEQDLFLLFEVSLPPNSKNTIVNSLHSFQGEVTTFVTNDIEKLKGWINTSKDTQKVIIPVFFMRDDESTPPTKIPYSVTAKDYTQTGTFTKCYFMSPIVVTFFHQVN